MCEECYSDENRITPLLNPLDCLETSCGIYEIENSKGRVSYKIFAGNEDLHLFLKKNRDKKCKQMAPVFTVGEYKEYPHTEVRKLTSDEIKQYMSER